MPEHARGQAVGAIPHEPPGFRPRADLLAELNQAGPTGPVVQVLTGAPGAGKTQLAAVHARTLLAAGWRLVAWVNAGDTATLLAGLAAVAEAAGLSGRGAGQAGHDPGRAVRHLLETDGHRRLLVFDDADDPDALRPFIPADGSAHVLVTSRRQTTAELGGHVPVRVFTAEEAAGFLAARTGLADAAGGVLAAELGYLPLALAQAAPVIASQHLGYQRYVERLRELSPGIPLVGADGQPYPQVMAETVLLSLDALTADDLADVCIGLMQLMAVLSAGGVRRNLLHAAGQAGVLTRDGHRVTLDLVNQALALLAERSLLTLSLDGQIVTAHRLVTRVLRDGLAGRSHLAAVCKAAASVLEASAQALAGSADRPSVRDFPQQVAALVDNTTGHAGQIDEDLAAVMLRLRFFALYHLIGLGDSAPQAIAVGEPLTADSTRLLGPEHPDTLGVQNNLAAAYQAAGRSAEAILMFQQALAGRERLLGPDHPGTLSSQNNLAAAYQTAGRSAEAIGMFRLTLAARERVLGVGHPETVNSRGNLAAAHLEAGQTAEAIPLLEQIVADREQALGAGHPDTISWRGKLAAAYRETGRTAEAIPQLEQIVAARERVLGADHPSTLGSRNNLAAAYRAAGRPAEAIPLHEQTLAACERLLGRDHQHTLISQNNLAVAYRDAGRLAAAIPLFEQILADRVRLLGPDHPDTLAARKNLILAHAEARRSG